MFVFCGSVVNIDINTHTSLKNIMASPLPPATDRNIHWKHVVFGDDAFDNRDTGLGPQPYIAANVTINKFGQIIEIADGTAGDDDSIVEYPKESNMTLAPDIKQGDIAVIDNPRRIYKAKISSPVGVGLPLSDWQLISRFDFGDTTMNDPEYALQFKNGDTSARMTYAPALGEPVWDSQTNQLFIGDGTTFGGNAVGQAGGSATYIAVDISTMLGLAINKGDVCVVQAPPPVPPTIPPTPVDHGTTYKNATGLNGSLADWVQIAAASMNLDMGIVV